VKAFELQVVLSRAMDRDKPVVVEINRQRIVEVGGVRLGRKLITLTLWTPRGRDR
jgi:hypothetical protein